MRNRILISMLMIFALSILSAKEEPKWVTHYKETGSVRDAERYYFGVGTSEKTSKEADETARTNFGMSIDTQVKSEVNSYFEEHNGKVKDSISKEIKITSDIGLKGVSISGRYFDGTKHFSLIRYKKTEYNEMLRKEVQRDLERQRIELEAEIENNKIEEQKHQEEIKKEKEKRSYKNSLKKLRKEFMLKMRNEYPDFFKSTPPYKAVSFRNGEQIPFNTQFNIKTGLFPISLTEVFLAYKVWLFEFSLTSKFYENKYNQQEAQIKYQIMPYSGDFYKFSAAFGFTAYKTGLIKNDFLESDIIYTPFVSGNVTLPDLHFSYLSIYADLTKTGIAVNNYLFYKQLKDRISAIAELNIYYNDDFKNRFNDTFVFQPGIVFKTTENLYTTFSYEDNEFWVFGIEIGF